MAHYPVMLNVADLLAVVVGGGQVGRRKVEGLLTAGAKVRVVDPAGGGRGAGGDWPAGVEVLAEAYKVAHLRGARLVFACTDDRAVNARIAADARAAGALVNVADDPAACDFTLPAVHRGAGLTLSVATTGGAPAAAAALRDLLAAALPEHAEGFALALASIRDRLKAADLPADRRRQVLRRLSGPEGMAAFQHGGREALEALGRPEQKGER